MSFHQHARIALTALAVMGAFLVGGCVGFAPTLKPPELSASVQRASIQVGPMNRSYLVYIPRNLPPNPALVFVLHGATQNAERMRVFTGFEFERLAVEHGFVVIYPNGYKNHWNDCRKAASYSARRNNINDEAFILALIERFHSTLGADRTRVFVMGYSNGGHLAYRLALEMPERITAIAAVAANLPTKDNCDCRKSGGSIPVMIINGTGDPINPDGGGKITLFGFGNRGTVLSSRKSAEYFARLDSQEGGPEISRLPSRNTADHTSVEKLDWHAPGKPEVVLESVQGGGHVVPQPNYKAPRFLGRTTHVVNGPEEIWNFFARQRPLAPAEQKP
jgi:polyhydroxybutyrate depolymerase